MDDLIRRNDAIEALYKYNFVTKEVIEREIMDIPSADRWILCSEREPNEFEDVLVLLSDGTMDVLQITDYLDIWGNVKWCHAVHHGSGCAVDGNEVVAWMPLPVPWKGADDE